MASKTGSVFLKHFTQLNASVHVYKPLSSLLNASDSNSTDYSVPASTAPDIILLLSWAGANIRHVAKFVPGYLELYPTAQIVLVTSSFTDFIYGSRPGQKNQLKPVIEAIRSDAEPVVLVHLFSNGGAHMLWRLAKLYKDHTGQLLPMNLLVLDSAPGWTTFKRVANAISYELPEAWYLRLPSMLLVYFMLSLFCLVLATTGQVNIVDRVWKELNWPQLISVKAFRCYIYSRTDKLVWWKDIEGHVDEAEAKGYKVRTETFEGTEHIAHMRSDATRYWKIVEGAWEQRQQQRD
ncbi:hypothetical protein MMC13_002418 [Lambiella insularis]|nr:hypothetical protein [Lambiella insularis]